MIAMAPHIYRSARPCMEFEYLILGDLRELLDEEPSRERDRWLLATLDMLLVNRPRAMAQVFLPPAGDLTSSGHFIGRRIPYDKLQRLRDRIAHRAPYVPLAEDLKRDLEEYLAGDVTMGRGVVVRAD